MGSVHYLGLASSNFGVEGLTSHTPWVSHTLGRLTVTGAKRLHHQN